MNLSEVRRAFIQVSGRFDLVVDNVDFVSKEPFGANWFINQGQRVLDRMTPSGLHREASIEIPLTAGQVIITNDDLRLVKEVWFEGIEGTKFLRKRTFEEARRLFGDKGDFSSVERGVPGYFVPISIRNPGTPTLESEVHKGILILPPAQTGVSVFVKGVFYSPKLVEDEDISFWSTAMPETLIQAAWYMLERFYRNTEGMKDHLEAINADLMALDHDAAEQDAAKVSQMRNSW